MRFKDIRNIAVKIGNKIFCKDSDLVKKRAYIRGYFDGAKNITKFLWNHTKRYNPKEDEKTLIETKSEEIFLVNYSKTNNNFFSIQGEFFEIPLKEVKRFLYIKDFIKVEK